MDSYFKLIHERPQLLGTDTDPLRIIKYSARIIQWVNERREKLNDSSNPVQWADIGIVLDDPRIVVLRDLVEFPSGNQNGYLRIYNRAYLEGGAAGVAILPEMNGKLLITYHFRHATRLFHWEVPRGFGNSGNDAETQARIELKEEIDGDVMEIIDLGIVYNNTGLEGNPINLFFVRMNSVGKMEVEEGIQSSKWVSIKQLEKMIADGEITDGFTIAAYTRAKLKGLI